MHGMTMEVDGTRQRAHPRMIWWECVKENMKSLVLFENDAH